MTEIRRLASGDLPLSAQLIRLAFAGVAHEFGLTAQNYPAHGAFLADDALRAEYESGVAMFGIFAQGRQAGFLSLNPVEGIYYLERLAVLPSERHKGYGRRMVEWAQKHVAAGGGGRIVLGALSDNRRLVRWYESCGFTEAAVRAYDHIPRSVSLMVWETPR